MAFTDYVEQFKWALQDEITALRSSGGQKTFISDGRHIANREGLNIYSFTADSELRFPDDTRVDVEYKGVKHEGSIVSIAGFDLIIALQDYIGDSIPTAVLYTAPWFLLEELQKRLSEIESQPSANGGLASGLIDGVPRADTNELNRAQSLLKSLEKQAGRDISYNEHQLKAVGKILGSKVGFIWGPPGTGKTKTLGLAVAALVTSGESVLIVAHSNNAVDVAMFNVAQNLESSQLYRDGKILRYGVTYLPALDEFPQLSTRGVVKRRTPYLIEKIESLEKQRRELIRRSRKDGLSESERERIGEEVRKVKADLAPLFAELKEKEKSLVGSASVVGCTLSKATISPEVHRRTFDAVLLDEASMAYIPHCAFVSSLAAQRVAVFGDFRQLAPIAQADTVLVRKWLQRDIFEQVGIIEKVNKGKGDARLVLLATQYRMHPAISSIPNMLFYGGQLQDGPNVATTTAPIVQSPPAAGKPLALYDLSQLSPYCFSETESHSRFNLISALVSVALAYSAVKENWGIGVITPYNAQSRLINRLLKDLKLIEQKVRVATVHRFQGSESDIIIFDTVEGKPKQPGRLVIGDVDSTAMRLVNVAVSRAKGKFIALADYPYIRESFSTADSFRQLLESISKQSPAKQISWPVWDKDLPGLQFFTKAIDAKEPIESDLVKAHEEIAIAWPTQLSYFHLSPQVLKRCDPSRVRFFVTGRGSQNFHVGLRNARIWEGGYQLPMGIVGIDRKRLWLYLSPNTSQGPVLQLDFPETVKLLYAFLRLIPEEEIRQDTLQQRIEGGKGLVGLPCPQCGNPLWPNIGKYGAYLACTGNECGYTKRITPSDATNLARVMGIVCDHCGGQAVGRKKDTYVFLGCGNYPECHWTKPIENLI